MPIKHTTDSFRGGFAADVPAIWILSSLRGGGEERAQKMDFFCCFQ